MDTKRSLYEIEVALAEHFNYIKNVIAFNVNGWSGVLPIFHECDMLVLSKAGFLTEIEIKRSYSDFLADFKKNHHHESELIKYFYYAVPESILEKARDFLNENNFLPIDGILCYDEDLNIRTVREAISRPDTRKLFIEQQFEVARLGAMRSVKLKKEIVNDLFSENK